MVAFAATLLPVFKPFASLMRNHEEVRYLVTPVDVPLVDGRGAASHVARRCPIAPGARSRDARRLVAAADATAAGRAGRRRDGARRQLGPERLRAADDARARTADVVNFPDVTACGTDTETSLPCMFAPVGRRDYDAARIRTSESLLHVLAHAGVARALARQPDRLQGRVRRAAAASRSTRQPAGLCCDGRCLDEVLLREPGGAAARQPATQVLVLHPLGSHGPAYFRRYPAGSPLHAHLRQRRAAATARRREIVNAYDNSLLYTDHFLARTIALPAGATTARTTRR